MHLKKALIWLLALLMLLSIPAFAEGETELRGYKKGYGWKFVQLGEYPYEKNGKVRPVMWRVLEIKDNVALLLTEYVIDTQQVIFEQDEEKIKKQEYRLISCYEESDLCRWLNEVCVERLFGNSPVRSLLVPDKTRGELFILTKDEFTNPEYGFSATVWNEQPSRRATGTPYAIKQRGLRGEDGGVSYWAAELKAKNGNKLALVGGNGHISWGGYTRQDVGLRLSVRVDLTDLKVTGGQGNRDHPYILTYTGDWTPTPVPTATPTPAPTATPVPVKTAAATATPKATATPAPTAVTAATPVRNNSDEVLLSFVGNCSIGDSEQFVTYQDSYHSTVEEKGYDWVFSKVQDYLAADDLTIANLESVITTKLAHTDKMYNLKAAPEHVKVLTAGSIEMVNTVNNHCMDFHRNGYIDMLDYLDKAGIDHFGSVYTSQPDGFDELAVQEVKGIRIGFMGFSMPQESDKKRIARRAQILREEHGCDLVVVSLHWGIKEDQPDAGKVAYAREVIDAGADLVWGHHPHAVQPIMFYKGKPIMFSTGTFTFGTVFDADPAAGIFQLAYEKVDGEVRLSRLQVIPCKVKPSPDYRPVVLTKDSERREVFKKLMMKRTYPKCENLPDSFLETGVVYFENGEMLR